MDFELRAAKEKLEREQRERKEKARIKIERERKAREEARRQQEALDAERQARRIEATQVALAESQQEEQDLVAGNGIRFNTTLHAIHYQGYGDKIKLPPSSFDKLSTQGAIDKGPMFFELSTVHQKETAGSPNRKQLIQEFWNLLQQRALLRFLHRFGKIYFLTTIKAP